MRRNPVSTREGMTSLLIGIGVGTMIGYFLTSQESPSLGNARRAVPDGHHWPEPDDDESEEDIVDRALTETFPASDSPAY